MVLFAIAAGYGLSMLLGVPFTSLQQILPFILIGIGVDDALSSWQRSTARTSRSRSRIECTLRCTALV